jgi:hypothetical protein
LNTCVDNIGGLLNSVIRWLENRDEDEKWWQLQTQVVQLCVLELDLYFKTREGGGLPTVIAGVRDMVAAMQRRDRTVALESGKHALDKLLNLESDNDPVR